jgi:phosphatidylglycerophosphate synthase
MSASPDHGPSPTAPASRRGFGERLRLVRSKRNQDWWSIVLGGPVAQVMAAVIGDVRFITPNGVTWVAFACKLACVPLVLVGTREADLAAVVCMQLNVVLDCLDGVLARYRKAGSQTGAFLDKVTDSIGLLALGGAFAYRVHRQSGDATAALLLCAACALWSVRMYAYWVVAFIEKERGAPKPTATADNRRPFGELGFGARLAYYVTSTWRIVLFAEADVFFWLGLGLLAGWERPVAYIVAAGLGAWSAGIIVYRYVTVVRLDAWLRDKAIRP